MAGKQPKRPAFIEVVRRGKTFRYDLDDEKDWGIAFDNLVLSIDAADGAKYYWPLDSVTLWKITYKNSLNAPA